MTPSRKSWLERLAYNLGKTIHDLQQPIKTQKQTVNQTVEEKQINATTTLRRTVIEEVEIKQVPQDD